MLTVIVMAAAVCQAPARADPPKPAASALAKPAAKAAAKPAARSATPTGAQERARLIAKRKARKSAAYAARVNREAREAADEAKAIKEAKAEFERTLPARLELRRQNLQRQATIERNVLLNRAVGAMERSAGYSYPGQSPMRGPF